uniref:Uncharacterized protein n=1 Tax=Oryza brachyantha TaxID=4533 RepID=J3N3H2_ORYBR
MDGVDFRKMTTTEIILACHLATELLDMGHEDRPPAAAGDEEAAPPPPAGAGDNQQQKKRKEDREIASVLSRYCLFLVVQIPELLPDDETWVSERYEATRDCLDFVSRWSDDPFFPTSRRWKKKNNIAKIVKSGQWEDLPDFDDPTARRGAMLFHRLRAAGAGKNEASSDEPWAQLARFWVHLLIYLAPSNDVQGPAKALTSWGSTDLITCLWALCTHAGLTRQPPDQPAELAVVYGDDDDQLTTTHSTTAMTTMSSNQRNLLLLFCMLHCAPVLTLRNKVRAIRPSVPRVLDYCVLCMRLIGPCCQCDGCAEPSVRGIFFRDLLSSNKNYFEVSVSQLLIIFLPLDLTEQDSVIFVWFCVDFPDKIYINLSA